MDYRHFTRLEEFIELARTGDIYREETPDSLTVLTFRAKSRRAGIDHLRAERLTTDLIARGDADYAYRTRARTGTLFNTRDRYGAPAFLGTSAQERLISLIEVAHGQHSLTGFAVHHSALAASYFGLTPQKVPA